MYELEYYKSLVTDQEVINALIKESKAREGELEKSRVRPNIQFFQRTVSNLVSSNNRIAANQEKLKAKEKEKIAQHRPKRVPQKRKMPIDYIKEILSNKVEFVKSKVGDADKCDVTKNINEKKICPSERDKNMNKKKAIMRNKTPFQQIREILTNNIDKSALKKASPLDTRNQSDPECLKAHLVHEPSTSNSFKNTKDLSSSYSSMEPKKRKYGNSSEDSINIGCSLSKTKHSVKKTRSIRQCSESLETDIISISDDSNSTCSLDSDSDSCIIIENVSKNGSQLRNIKSNI